MNTRFAKRRTTKRIRPDLRSISLPSLEDQAIWKALSSTQDMSALVRYLIRGFAKHPSVPEARQQEIITGYRRAVVASYNRRIAELEGELQDHINEINTILGEVEK